ncbi:PGN_0703 family putative restriction endonuclease [Aureimonas ureilytica]|uniref:PGN_0703 family putative restriction endonuclease n=1 Tax=Aureimonas ureilytica TaxID=401562 RepID=UPI00039DBB2E|nr:hypothetical protein [Aureimonas ureilytica]
MASPNRPIHPAAATPAASSTPQATGALTETDRPSDPAQVPSAPPPPSSPPSPAPAPPAQPREPFFILGPSRPAPADPEAARPIAGLQTAPDAAAFDPIAFGPQPTIPLLPDALLKRHRTFVHTDTRFRAAARLLQCLWREDRQLPIGLYRDGNGRRRKLGSRLTATDARQGANFISPAIARLVEKELIYREIGAVIEEERLRQNLLSSQPLCFNLFGPMKLDLGLATAVCEQLLPGFFRKVVDVRFEHSPARGHKAFVGDGTAFDVLLRGYTPAGRRAFVGIEVKLTEGCHEPLPRFSGCYEEIAQSSSLFVDPGNPALRANPVQQLFRQTCLGAAMLRNELYDEGLHLLIAPQDNHLAQNAADSFRRQLREPDTGRLPFRAISLETVIGAIATAGEPELARLLHRRYCDYGRIEALLELEPVATIPQMSETSAAA